MKKNILLSLLLTVSLFTVSAQKNTNPVIKKSISIVNQNDLAEKKYFDYLKKTPSSISSNKILIGKKVYSAINNLMLRSDIGKGNEAKSGVVPNKDVYLGTVTSLAEDEIGDLWIEIYYKDRNSKLDSFLNWGTGVNAKIRYIKATDVFIKI